MRVISNALDNGIPAATLTSWAVLRGPFPKAMPVPIASLTPSAASFPSGASKFPIGFPSAAIPTKLVNASSGRRFQSNPRRDRFAVVIPGGSPAVTASSAPRLPRPTAARWLSVMVSPAASVNFRALVKNCRSKDFIRSIRMACQGFNP